MWSRRIKCRDCCYRYFSLLPGNCTSLLSSQHRSLHRRERRVRRGQRSCRGYYRNLLFSFFPPSEYLSWRPLRLCEIQPLPSPVAPTRMFGGSQSNSDELTCHQPGRLVVSHQTPPNCRACDSSRSPSNALRCRAPHLKQRVALPRAASQATRSVAARRISSNA